LEWIIKACRVWTPAAAEGCGTDLERGSPMPTANARGASDVHTTASPHNHVFFVTLYSFGCPLLFCLRQNLFAGSALLLLINPFFTLPFFGFLLALYCEPPCLLPLRLASLSRLSLASSWPLPCLFVRYSLLPPSTSQTFLAYFFHFAFLLALIRSLFSNSVFVLRSRPLLLYIIVKATQFLDHSCLHLFQLSESSF
jgi:hypothetical protein